MIFQINSPKYGVKDVLIDDEDWDKVKQYKWSLKFHRNTFYVKSNSTLKNKSIYITFFNGHK
jgi:hypothetical protein